jgi:hypothetical protein
MKQSELDSMSLTSCLCSTNNSLQHLRQGSPPRGKRLNIGYERLARRRAGPRTSKSFERTRACRSGLQDSIAPGACRICLGAELVERHRAKHRDPLAEHLERHPHGALAALVPDPRKPSASSWEMVRLSAIRASKRGLKRERISFRLRSIPGCCAKGLLHR